MTIRDLLKSDLVVLPAYGLSMMVLGVVIIRAFRNARREARRDRLRAAALNGIRPHEDR